MMLRLGVVAFAIFMLASQILGGIGTAHQLFASCQ